MAADLQHSCLMWQLSHEPVELKGIVLSGNGRQPFQVITGPVEFFPVHGSIKLHAHIGGTVCTMIITQKDLADVRARHPGKKLVLTSGTFDLLHVGHLRYLTAVKSYGDVVVVMLSGDARVAARKGASRPVIGEDDRGQILDALKVVDYVFIDPGSPDPEHAGTTYADILAALEPDVYVTDGEDIRFSRIMDKNRMIILPRASGGTHASTTAIIDHIASQTH